MKELVHTKRFKRHLCKWIFMYLSVIVLFTSVVTYSKYVSAFKASDNARVAKFKVGINYLGSSGCVAGSNNLCIDGIYSPTEEIPYTFRVDTRELEVKTLLVLTINIKNTAFDIENVLIANGSEYVDISNVSDVSVEKNGTYIKIMKIVEANGGGIQDIRLVVKYNKGTFTGGYYVFDDSIDPQEIISVDYVATQLD